jgi:hypothetical protein
VSKRTRTVESIEVETGSGNVPDLRLAEAEKLEIKSGLVIEVTPGSGLATDSRPRRSWKSWRAQQRKTPAVRGFFFKRCSGFCQWNCSSSVEPVSALTLELPPWITVVTSSK